MMKVLYDYAKEIGMGDAQMTVEQLVDSHRRLRAAALRSSEERLREAATIRANITRATEADLKERGWFSVERLRSMTLGELADLIHEED